MRQFFSISLAFGLSVTPLAVSQLALAQSESPITHEGSYWVRTFAGSISGPAMERFRLDTVGSVLLRGNTQDRAVYKLKARVRARDVRDAADLLGQFEVKSRT